MCMYSYIYRIIKCLFLFLIINKIFKSIDIKYLKRKIISNKESANLNIYTLNDIFIYNNRDKRILIFEPFKYHYECTPGYSKYFIDLGYNVDIIMNEIGITSYYFFEYADKIRIFFYKKIDDIKEKDEFLPLIFNNYKYILIETTEPREMELYKILNLFNIKQSIFVFHHLDYVNEFSLVTKLNKNKIWCLGNYGMSTQVNPHYFGKFKTKKKNRITKFFITSTINRKYNFLVSATKKLKNERIKFHVIVVGKWKTFSENDIPTNLKDIFTFKYKISYFDLFKEVYNSDYIIINLDPKNPEDIEFKKRRVTGSAQLAFGFLKPVLIHKNFAKNYNFNSNNSFLYEDSNFSQIMKTAINLENKSYMKMKRHLFESSKVIYNNSLNNVKKCLNEL